MTAPNAALLRPPADDKASAAAGPAHSGGVLAAIITAADREIALWSRIWPEMPDWAVPARRERIGMLREIRAAAIAAQDHAAGHEGFEDAPAELDALVTEWAETVDYRTFPRLSDAELVAVSKGQRAFEGRR